MNGALIYARNTSTGTVSTLRSMWAYIPQNSAGGSVANMITLDVSGGSNAGSGAGGTVGTAYAIRVGNMAISGANNYAIFTGTCRIRFGDNVGINTVDYGGGAMVLALSNATTVPTTNPSAGGVIYVEAGALKYQGSSGTATVLGVA